VCGICGFIRLDATPVDASLLQRMSGAIAHRGPDDVGYALWSDRLEPAFFSDRDAPEHTRASYPLIESAADGDPWRVGFSHRRFSIIDTTAAGHQPFADPSNDYVLVFNGEVFNYIELRRELEAWGHGPFRTQSDTEVALAAYRAWGTECFKRFNGFWAIAIFDKARRRVVFSRDRFGQKPLYLRRLRRTLFFSSEIRGLSGFEPFGPTTINLDAAMLYLLYDRRNTFEGCLFNEVTLFPAGHTAVLDLATGEWREQSFWRYPEKRLTERDISLEEAVSGFRSRLETAVSIRLRADVPVCANLSGGIDSSAIVCMAQSILGDRARLSTNLIRYTDAPELDEQVYADQVAKAVGTDHEELFIDASTFGREFAEITRKLEEPVHTPAFYSQHLAWRHIRDRGFRVILHGSAADELLIGYPYLRDVADVDMLNRLDVSGYWRAHSWRDWRNALRLLKRCGQGLVFPDLSNPLRTLIGLPDRRYWIPEDQPEVFKRYFRQEFLAATDNCRRRFNAYMIEANRDPSSRIRADFELLRIGFWNNAMDKSMMAIPVEIRMPFLDHELVQYSMQLPISYLYRDGWTKYILRRAVEDQVPHEVNWCAGKRGFTAPVRKWLDAHASSLCELLSEPGEVLSALVDTEAVVRDFSIMPARMLWRIVNLGMCLRD